MTETSRRPCRTKELHGENSDELHVRLRPDDKDRLKRVADRASETVSAYARRVLMEAIRRDEAPTMPRKPVDYAVYAAEREKYLSAKRAKQNAKRAESMKHGLCVSCGHPKEPDRLSVSRCFGCKEQRKK